MLQRSGATIIWCTSISLPGWTGRCVRCAESRSAENLRTGAKFSSWPKSSPGYFFDVQNRLKNSLKVGSWGSSAMATGGTHRQTAARSQPDGLCPLSRSSRFQREIVKIHAVFGGKNPHPNGLSAECLALLTLTKAARSGRQYGTPEPGAVDYHPHGGFHYNVMIPDALAIGQFNKPWSESALAFRINAFSVTARSRISPRLWREKSADAWRRGD